MNRTYSSIKLFKTKKFNSKKEETDYFIKIQNENVFEYRHSLISNYEEFFHVMWSRKLISQILSFITLLLSFYFHDISYVLFTISLLLILTSLYYKHTLNKKQFEYNFVMPILNSYIENEYGLVLG